MSSCPSCVPCSLVAPGDEEEDIFDTEEAEAEEERPESTEGKS